ncbi:hypothetical protein [Peribacillus muralis]|uniref:hypothetical protein n=1 Tax=Peribacillus muralis TaxID=264697 RepID=UPI003D042D7E
MIRDQVGIPVGIKMVIGGNDSVEELARYMKKAGKVRISSRWMAVKEVRALRTRK